jgi:hypothetical protein
MLQYRNQRQKRSGSPFVKIPPQRFGSGYLDGTWAQDSFDVAIVSIRAGSRHSANELQNMTRNAYDFEFIYSSNFEQLAVHSVVFHGFEGRGHSASALFVFDN